MRKRLTVIMAAISVLALATGVAWAAIPPEPVRIQPASVVANDQTIDVADAGTVTLTQSELKLEILRVDVKSGWTNEIEVATGREVEVEFTSPGRRIQFSAELEDGEIRVRVRERTGSTVVETSSTTIIDTTSTSEGGSTSTTVDDSTSTSEDHSTSTTVDNSTSTTTNNDSTSTTVGDSTSTTIDDDTPTGSGTETYSVGAVATVTIAWSDGHMTLTSVSVADGWSIEKQEVRSDRVKIEFERGDSEAKFEARFKDGSIRVETELD